MLPHQFLCHKRNVPPTTQEMGANKRQKVSLKDTAINYVTSQEKESFNNQIDLYQAGQSTSYDGNISRWDKAVQVNIRSKYRSKDINVKLTARKINTATSPLKLIIQTMWRLLDHYLCYLQVLNQIIPQKQAGRTMDLRRKEFTKIKCGIVC